MLHIKSIEEQAQLILNLRFIVPLLLITYKYRVSILSSSNAKSLHLLHFEQKLVLADIAVFVQIEHPHPLLNVLLRELHPAFKPVLGQRVSQLLLADEHVPVLVGLLEGQVVIELSLRQLLSGHLNYNKV